MEDSQRQHQEQLQLEEQISQLQREESMRKDREKKKNSARIVQGVLKPKKENSLYEDRTMENNKHRSSGKRTDPCL